MRRGGSWRELVKIHGLKSNEATCFTEEPPFATHDLTGPEGPRLIVWHRIHNTVSVFSKLLR